MEQLQGSLRLSLQGNPKIIKEIEDQRLCSKCTQRTSQCGTFHQYAAGPHPGAGKSRNGDTIRQNLSFSDHEDGIRAIKPTCYPNRETHDSAIPERPSEKNREIVRPRPSTTIGRPEIRPHQIRTLPKTAMSIQGADTNSNLMDIAHFTGTR